MRTRKIEVTLSKETWEYLSVMHAKYEMDPGETVSHIVDYWYLKKSGRTDEEIFNMTMELASETPGPDEEDLL